MATYKEIWYFSASGTTGSAWTETFHANASSLAEAAKIGDPFINKRLAFLDPTNNLLKIRVSEVGNTRVSTLRPVGKRGTWKTEGSPYPIPTACVCAMGSTTPAATRRLWLRGGSTGMFWRDSTSGADVFGTTFREAFNTFVTALVNLEYGILPLSKLVAGGPYPKKVTTVDGSITDGRSTLSIDNNPGLIVGNRIILSKFNKKVLPGLNGSYTLLAVTPTSLTIQYSTPGGASIQVEEGQLRPETRPTLGTFVQNLCQPQYISSHQSRGFFSNVRGARRAEHLRRSQ